MRKEMFLVLTVFLVSLAIACGSSLADTPKERALKTARQAAENAGILVGEAELIYDPVNRKWEERIAAIEKLPADPNHGRLPHGILYEKKYETVLLDFKEGARQADAWVFIDKDTGDVLTVYQEKR